MKKIRGFTLIELLVVITIIALLAGLALSFVNVSKAKARDVKRKGDFHALANALYLYYDQVGRFPYTYQNGSPSTGEWFFEVQNHRRGSFWPEDSTKTCCASPDVAPNGAQVPNWEESMSELVSAKLIGEVPHSPASPAYNPYWYHNYSYKALNKNGVPIQVGAILAVNLETSEPSFAGESPSDRPWPVLMATAGKEANYGDKSLPRSDVLEPNGIDKYYYYDNWCHNVEGIPGFTSTLSNQGKNTQYCLNILP